MTTYTEANPFEFEGVKVWSDPTFVWLDRAEDTSALSADQANAVHAFIEAERNADWHWTNDEHTEARKGRWVAHYDEFAGAYHEKWAMGHDDFPGSRWNMGHAKSLEGQFTRNEQTAALQRASFLTWQAAQAPTFTPLPIPEVGAYISATLRNGRVVEGEVAHVNASDGCAALSVGGVFVTINRTESVEKHAAMPADIIAWHPIARPQPEEPTGLGAVVEVNSATWVRVPTPNSSPWRHPETRLHTRWEYLLARGPVTVLSEGVTK